MAHRRVSRLVASPFHNGLAEFDRGRGPRCLLDVAAKTGVAASLGDPSIETIDAPDPAAAEAKRVFQIGRGISDHVTAAIADGALPIVLAGDCNSSLGTVAGCGSAELGIVWFDAHADFDTPEVSTNGSLDSMALGIVTGSAWPQLARTMVDLAPVDESRVVLAGVRDLDDAQRARLQQSRVRTLWGNRFTDDDLGLALDELRGQARRVYLHVDLDSLDPSEGVANQFSAPDGLTTRQLLSAIDRAFDRFAVAAAAITAYNPDSDAEGRMAATAMAVLTAIAERA